MTLRITWLTNGLAIPRFGRAKAQSVVVAALRAHGVRGPCRLTVLFVDDAESARLHGEHFADPTATDVMTFPDGSHAPGRTRALLLGDLAVGIEVAQREAASRQRTVGDELILYILHGVLHLLGFDDRDERARRRMWREQRRLLSTVGITLEAQPG